MFPVSKYIYIYINIYIYIYILNGTFWVSFKKMIPSLCSYIFSMWSQLLLIISGVSWFTEWFYQSKWKHAVAQCVLILPTRLLHPWNFPGKSGLPFPSRGDLPDPGIEPKSPTLQEDTLPSVWATREAISFSRGTSRPRDQTPVSCIVGRPFYCLSHKGSHPEKHKRSLSG